MSILGKDFITAANKCMELSSETGYRNAISRAYYALYHETCSILTCCPPTTHEGVVQYLLSDARRKNEPYELMVLVQLGAVLKQQKVKRKRSDYDLNDTIIESEAISSITTANKLIEKIYEIKK